MAMVKDFTVELYKRDLKWKEGSLEMINLGPDERRGKKRKSEEEEEKEEEAIEEVKETLWIDDNNKEEIKMVREIGILGDQMNREGTLR